MKSSIILYLLYSVLINSPKIALLIFSIVISAKRKYAKSSKFFLLLGMIVLLISWIPTIIGNYSYNDLTINYNFGYALYFLSLYSGIFIGFILLLISFLFSYKIISNSARGIWISCLLFLLCSYAALCIGILIPNEWILISFLAVSWALEITSYSILIKIASSFGVHSNVSDKEKSFNADEYQIIIADSKNIKDQIFKKINSSANIKKMISPVIISQLNEFIGQIEKLVTRKKYLDKVVKNETINEIDDKLKDLKMKHDNAKEDNLKKEYEKSILQIKDHKVAFSKMLSQKEIINLKINSAVTSLNQLHLTVTNMDEIMSNEDNYSFKEFQNTLKDISDYVTNLQNSYHELEDKYK